MKRALGAVVIAGAVVALGWATGVIGRPSFAPFGTAETVEQQTEPAPEGESAAPSMKSSMSMMSSATVPGASETRRPMPALDGAIGWLNGPPLTTAALQGKVVLIDFWTYSNIGSLRAAPYVEAWSRKYKDWGLVVIGIHSPEFAFERDAARVAKAVSEFGLTYPVAVDSELSIWGRFDRPFWPSRYLVDAKGVIRFHHSGEGSYDETEALIQSLLKERGSAAPPAGAVKLTATGVQAAPDIACIQSPETYVGYERQENFTSPEPVAKDRAARYTSPAMLEINQWALSGQWTVGGERAVSSAAGARIVFSFHARDLHLVLGPRSDGKPVRFRVSIDGHPPLESHGLDVDSAGLGRATEYRLYQLIRQPEPGEDRLFQIEFLDPGVQAFAFTFG